MKDVDAVAVRDMVSAQLGIPLALSEIRWAGSQSHALRLREIETENSFSIGLELTPRRAEAFLIMDRYAGPVVRSMESSTTSDPSAWPELMEAGLRRDVTTTVTVNGNDLVETAASQAPWTSLEITCVKKITRSETTPLTSLIDAGVACLSMALSAIVLEFDTDISADDLGEIEGGISHVVSTKYERSPINRFRCIDYYGSTCWVCDTDFRTVYGELGANFIEVHHRTPISELGGDYRIDPRRDLVPLCSNCHSMIHREKPPLSPMALRERLGRASKHILSRDP
jgi:5-methylcytosine-specific restriction protein A